jgi:hypothetical protein
MIGEALGQRRAEVLERWFHSVIATYPEETAKFLLREKDRFHNPVAHAVRTGLERLLDGLCAGSPAAELAPALDGIIRIRAVQELQPSAAVGFVIDLKRVLREAFAGGGLPEAERAALEEAIDRLALEAFDVYARCRETLFEIRVRELKEYHLMSARAGGCVPMTCGGPQTPAREGR